MSEQTPEASAAPSRLASIAERIARVLHADQRDKQGAPYVEHLRRVAEAVEGDKAQAVAWLHDSLEDALTDADGWLRLVNMGIESGAPTDAWNDIVREVNALSRQKEIPYELYIASIAQRGGIAREVKIADLRDNMRPGGPERLYARYRKALAALGAAPASPRAEQVETAIKALERAGNAIHSEYCTRVCHRECVAVDEALALLRQGEAGKD